MQIMADVSGGPHSEFRIQNSERATADSALHPPHSALPTLGDYRIIREVGRGGMGIVYEAEQLSLRRRVALKVLPFASALDPRQLQRFHNEALAAASLHHEHIIPVFAVGSERGVHFYAMQFIDGCTLADVITELAASVQGSGFSVQKGQDTGTSSQDAAVLAASLPETERRQPIQNRKSKIQNCWPPRRKQLPLCPPCGQRTRGRSFAGRRS